MFFVHHIEVLFIDQHGLLILPLLPSLRGNVLKNFLARRAWKGRGVKTG